MDFQIVQVIDEQTLVITEVPPAEIVAVAEQGPSGPSSIGGYGITVDTATPGDLLMFGNQNTWVNVPKTQITDGGNF